MMEDSNSNSLDPLCIILVKTGAHGGKLLFRYPISANLSQQHHKKYSLCLTICKDLLNQRVNTEPTNI